MSGWQPLGERVLHSGWRVVVGRRFRTPDGVEREFEVIDEPDTAVVVALTEAGDVVLVREFRPGPLETLLELPGGLVDDGESPEDAAARELLEETGYAGDLRAAGFVVDSAYSTRRRHTFVATGCRRVREPVPQDGEFPEVELLSLEAFREHLRGGRCTDVAAGYAGLDALRLL